MGLLKGDRFYLFSFFAIPSFLISDFVVLKKEMWHVSFLLSETYKDFLCGQTHGWFFWLSDGMGLKNTWGQEKGSLSILKPWSVWAFQHLICLAPERFQAERLGLKTRTSPGFCPTALEEERGELWKNHIHLFSMHFSRHDLFFSLTYHYHTISY